MNDTPRPSSLPLENSPEDRASSVDELALERQMRELGLSSETRRFLRNLHAAEKQLNDAFSVAHQGGELEQRVSRVYREMYGAD